MTMAKPKSKPRIRKRTRGRELALQYLYQYDLLGTDGAEDVVAFFRAHEPEDEAIEFGLMLVRGVIEHAPAIDAAINSIATNWTLARMVVVDRTILRIATFELGFAPQIPTRVAINEAIELAKRYSTDKSSAFVNGILDRIPGLLGVDAERPVPDATAPATAANGHLPEPAPVSRSDGAPPLGPSSETAGAPPETSESTGTAVTLPEPARQKEPQR